MSLLDVYLETLVKEGAAEAQECSRFSGLSISELSAIAGIKTATARGQMQGAGEGKGMPGGLRRNKNERPCSAGGPGKGLGGGRGKGASRGMGKECEILKSASVPTASIRNPISDILSDPELKKLAKSWEKKASSFVWKAPQVAQQAASRLTGRMAGARQARLASRVPAQTAAQARAPMLTGAGGGELTAREMSATRGPMGNMAAKVQGFFNKNKPMAPPVPAMAKAGSVKKAFIIPSMIGASAAEPGREWEGAAKGFVGGQLGGLAGAAGGAALGAGGGALYHHLQGVEGHPDMKSYRYSGGKLTPKGTWKSGRMVSKPLQGSRALAAAKDIRNMRMLGGTAVGMLAGTIPGMLYGAYKGGRSARTPSSAEKTGSVNTLELILEKLGFVSAAELARASARKLPTKMVGKAKSFKRPAAPKTDAKEPEYASLVRQFHKQGSISVIQQILDKIAAAEDQMGSIELNPEDMREAFEDAAGREDVEARGRRWGLGSGVAGGALGVGAGAGLGRLLQSRMGPWGYAAAPLLGGAGALAGSRLGEAHGAEEALHDKLVEALRQRSAAQRGFMSGVEAGGYPFGQGR